MFLIQGCSKGTSSVAFELLIINCQIDFMNLFIFNCSTSHINLLILQCLLTSNFCFPKFLLSFASSRERLFIDARPEFRILNSPAEMMTCYLRDTNKILKYRTLCTSILKSSFLAKGI